MKTRVGEVVKKRKYGVKYVKTRVGVCVCEWEMMEDESFPYKYHTLNAYEDTHK
ncbi:hypothetical protein GCM10010129_83610 [Streptomyces fumigatiscleroticus]|nr:hypothetical protein GCM10010129_83610 [Streptomyces fumigatiscleroticus]